MRTYSKMQADGLENFSLAELTDSMKKVDTEKLSKTASNVASVVSTLKNKNQPAKTTVQPIVTSVPVKKSGSGLLIFFIITGILAIGTTVYFITKKK